MFDYSELTDNELADLLKRGNRIAFTEIYDRYFAPLYQHACNRLRDKSEAKDVVQDLFTTLWAKQDTIDFKSNFSNYLYAAVRNRILNIISHKEVQSKYFLSLPDEIDRQHLITDHQIRERQLASIIEKEIQALPPKMREVFELSRKLHLSHREIAERLDISEQSVRSHIKNALRILRKKLGLMLYLSMFLYS